MNPPIIKKKMRKVNSKYMKKGGKDEEGNAINNKNHAVVSFIVELNNWKNCVIRIRENKSDKNDLIKFFKSITEEYNKLNKLYIKNKNKNKLDKLTTVYNEIAVYHEEIIALLKNEGAIIPEEIIKNSSNIIALYQKVLPPRNDKSTNLVVYNKGQLNNNQTKKNFNKIYNKFKTINLSTYVNIPSNIIQTLETDSMFMITSLQIIKAEIAKRTTLSDNEKTKNIAFITDSLINLEKLKNDIASGKSSEVIKEKVLKISEILKKSPPDLYLLEDVINQDISNTNTKISNAKLSVLNTQIQKSINKLSTKLSNPITIIGNTNDEILRSISDLDLLGVFNKELYKHIGIAFVGMDGIMKNDKLDQVVYSQLVNGKYQSTTTWPSGEQLQSLVDSLHEIQTANSNINININ